MADLLRQHAERAVLAEELRGGSSGYFADAVHHHHAAQPAAAAEVARRVEDLVRRCRGSSFATVNSKANVPRDERLSVHNTS